MPRRSFLKSPFVIAISFLMLAADIVRGADAPPGAVALNVEPTKENPRNSEGSFATLDPDGLYHYTAIHFTGDAVLLGYCAGDSKVGALNRLRIRRISLDSLRQKPNP